MITIMTMIKDHAKEFDRMRAEWKKVYYDYLESWTWIKKRETCIANNNFKCTYPDCNAEDDLEVHHLHYKSIGREDPEKDLTTLCSYHHKLLHGIIKENDR